MRLVCALVFLMANHQAAQAVLATYSDRTDWEAAGSGAVYTVDFDGIGTDVSYNDPNTFNAGPFSLKSVGADNLATPLNHVDAAPFRVTAGGVNLSVNNTTMLSSRLSGSGSSAVIIEFDQPVSAFGADFARTVHSPLLTITFHKVGGGTEQVNVPSSNDPHFFGVVDDPSVAYSSLSFDHSGVDAFWLMDNLSGIVAVPEPSAFLLVGAVGLGVWSRRRPTSSPC